MLKALIIERSLLVRKSLMEILKELKINFETFEDVHKALQYLLNHEVQLIIGEFRVLKGVDVSFLKGVPVIYTVGLFEEAPRGGYFGQHHL